MVDVGEVHRAALAAAAARAAPGAFAEDGGHRHAAQQRVVVAAVGAEGLSSRPHRGGEAGGHGLLAEAQVGGALDEALHEQVVGALLEHSGAQHALVEEQARGLGDFKRAGRRGDQAMLPPRVWGGRPSSALGRGLLGRAGVRSAGRPTVSRHAALGHGQGRLRGGSVQSIIEDSRPRRGDGRRFPSDAVLLAPAEPDQRRTGSEHRHASRPSSRYRARFLHRLGDR